MSLPPLLFALLMWFIGTAAVVWLDSLPARTFRTSLTLAGLVTVAATMLVWARADDAGAGGAEPEIGAACAGIVRPRPDQHRRRHRDESGERQAGAERP
ncbi:MAG: DUF3623 family protein, partial [Sphingomonas sp.]